MASYLKQQLNDIFVTALAQAFPSLAGTEVEIMLSNQQQLADYQCNSAMKLARFVQLSPRDFAQKWCDNILRQGLIKNIDIAGPGFINIRLSEDYLAARLLQIDDDPQLGIDCSAYKNQRMIVEFSSPNTAKQMHVGHLRGTIIGDCLARVFEFLQADVLRLNHIGDWGTQFGMLIAYLRLENPKILSGEQQADLTALVAWYKASKQKFDDDELFKKQAQAEVIALQSGNAESLAAWKIICQISRENYQEIYDLLDVKLTERGESFYNPFLSEMVEDLTQKGLVQISNGAKCIFLEGFKSRDDEPLPMIIQKSDGGYNYSSTDTAAMRYRTQVDRAQRIIVLTDIGQTLHFSMITQLAEKAGYLDASHVRFDHVTFGLVLGFDGKKIKTRAGDTEPLINLIYTAIEEAGKIIRAREHQLTTAEEESLAKILGINAIKYADLACNRTGDYKFSYQRMLQFEGNTAAFLMYSYVRMLSIQRKVGATTSQPKHLTLTHSSERQLVFHLARFDEVILQLADDLLPHRLCEYLYQLAENFNAFFRDCRVEGSCEEASRLLLCSMAAKILLKGMRLLGLNPVDRM
jgi:arginyl-tRNA synthetase